VGLRLIGEHEREPGDPPHHTGNIAKKKKKRDPHAKRKEDLLSTGEHDLLCRLTMIPGLWTKMKTIVDFNKGKGRDPKSLNQLALTALVSYVEANYDIPEPELEPEPTPLWEED